jgi:hypothetical protein
MSAIDRVLYYDGEFLRAFDFQDEQAYHREMRRRLNRYLHLYGIVRGLQLNDAVQGTVHSVSILEGLAIDAFGREIYVFSSYTLGDQDIQVNRIPAGVANYDVWLRYNKTPQTPPSSGYNNCNQANQFTRWQEGFSVVLLKHGTKLFTPPQFTDDDSDDPTQDQVGVLLGTVQVDSGSATQQFSIPAGIATPDHDHFWGSIIQRIQTPPGYDARASFQFANQQSPRNPPVSLEIYPNIFAGQNLILGPDFSLQTTPQTKVPTVNVPGAAKLAGDLFVQGTIYSSIPDSKAIPQWVGLNDFVKQSVQQYLPEIVPFTVTETVTNDNAATLAGIYASGSITYNISTSRITNVTSTAAFAYFSRIGLTDPANNAALLVAGNSPLLQMVAPPTAAFPANSQNGTVSITWKTGPATAKAVPPPPIGISYFDNFTISGFVICYP